jgi:hypothetical protein
MYLFVNPFTIIHTPKPILKIVVNTCIQTVVLAVITLPRKKRVQVRRFDFRKCDSMLFDFAEPV